MQDIAHAGAFRCTGELPNHESCLFLSINHQRSRFIPVFLAPVLVKSQSARNVHTQSVRTLMRLFETDL